MEKVNLLRTSTSDQGTLGVLDADGFDCRTIELPWRNNSNNISCILEGEYEAVFINSNKYGPCYWIKGVPGRTGILIHAGNVAGDKHKGYKTHSYGCILPGKYDGQLWGQKAVLSSQFALSDFLDFMQRKPFKLVVKEMFK